MVKNLLRDMDELDKIFKAYDIRGIYPEEINEELAYKLGKASAKILAQSANKKLVIARDDRSSSEKLLEAIIKGITDFGVDIINIGLSATPVFYYAVKEFKVNGGIMVTASHNSENYNGFKIVKENAMPIVTKGLEKIKKNTAKNITTNSNNKGRTETKEILRNYINSILKLGQGNLQPSDLSDFTSKFNFNIEFDNDKDRIFFTDENNRKIDPDLISAILIHYCFKNAGKILYTPANSRIVKEEAIKNGNKIILSRIGHSFIKEIMAKKQIVFGCEASGHYYFKETEYMEAPLLVLMRIIEIMQETKKSLADLVNEFNKYYLERIEFEIVDTEKFKSQFKNIKKEYKKSAKISFLDGITVEAKDWRFNLRASNTEPLMRLTIEANTKELLEEQKEKLIKLIPFSF
jgi:phosphomannomutase